MARATEDQKIPTKFIALMAALMALNALAIDIILPALFAIGQDFNVPSKNDQQLVIVAYIIGLGAAQLFVGPLADRYGRKRPLLVSIVGYTIFAILSAFAPSFIVLVAARALQGAFASGARVISVSVVRDTASGDQMAQVMSLIMMTFMVVPILAPNLGWAILLIGDWRMVFAALAILGFGLLIWTGAGLKETLNPKHRRSINVKAVARSYWAVVKTPASRAYTISLGMIFGAFFTFISTSEQIFRDIYQITDRFPLYFSSIAFFLALSSFTNSRMVRRFGAKAISQGALIALVALTLTFVIFHKSIETHVLFFVAMMSAIFFLFGLIGPNFNALAMKPLGHIAGVASAAVGFTSTALSGAIGGFVGRLFDGSLFALSGGFATFSSLALITLSLHLRNDAKRNADNRSKTFNARRRS